MDSFGRSRTVRQVEAVAGLVATHIPSQFTGTVVALDRAGVVLKSRSSGFERHFPLRAGDFLVGGTRATLVRPASPESLARLDRSARDAKAPMPRTASGSIPLARTRAVVARTSRLLVEGVHDAELVEKVWGDDLRADGIVVELLDGIDHLGEVIDAFGPGPDARLGVLADHLVPGSKEQRIAWRLEGPDVLIRGTPFVDVWQAIRPGVVGIEAWPVVPPGRPWKQGICEAFDEPSPGRLWKHLLARVKTYADLEPELVGAVESLIDFVTEVG